MRPRFVNMDPVELQRVKEEFQLKLFWKEHSYEIMEKAMSRANEAEGGPACSCLTCQLRGTYSRGVTQKEACRFNPWFEHVLREHDMSVGRGYPKEPLWDVWFGGTVDESRAQVIDDGQHFHNKPPHDWCGWRYGSKLWKATSVCDPELAKLERLLHYLNTFGTQE